LNRPDATPESFIECPQCGCSYVDHLKDSNTGEEVRSPDRRMLVCKFCGNIFPVFSEEVRVKTTDHDLARIRAERSHRPWRIIGMALALLGVALWFGWIK
jgi:hypothetical protein